PTAETTGERTCPSRLDIQRADADLSEIDDVAGIVVLETDESGLGPFRLALSLEPLPVIGNVLAIGIEARDSLAVDVHKHKFFLERDDHRPPLGRTVLGQRSSLCQ